MTSRLMSNRKSASMTVTPLDVASHWLNWANALYVGGAAMTVRAAMYLFYENRAIAAGKHVKHYLMSEFFAAFAAIVSLIGTMGAIHFSNRVSSIKDTDLKLMRRRQRYRSKTPSAIQLQLTRTPRPQTRKRRRLMKALRR